MWRIFLQNQNSQLPPPFLPIHRPSLYPYSLSPLMMRCQKEVEGSIQNCINDSFWSTVANYLLKMNWKFIMLKFKSESNPLDLGSMLWPSWHVIHHIKPTQGGYLEVKGFQDPSTYGWENYHITIQRNFWTHCSCPHMQVLTLNYFSWNSSRFPGLILTQGTFVFSSNRF